MNRGRRIERMGGVAALLLLSCWATGAHATLTKTAIQDGVCALTVKWKWDPPTLNDTDSYASANWGVSILIDASGPTTRLVVGYTHNAARCHPVDLANPVTAFEAMTIPAQNTTKSAVFVVNHPTSNAERHADDHHEQEREQEADDHAHEPEGEAVAEGVGRAAVLLVPRYRPIPRLVAEDLFHRVGAAQDRGQPAV